MKFIQSSFVTLTTAAVAAGQAVNWCKDSGCKDCVSAITTAGTGYPQCVIYDTETVFGGQGFEPSTGGKLLYKVFGQFSEPCGGGPGSLMIRSPASLTEVGCGNLIYNTMSAQCSTDLHLEKSFMVQFCCGSGDCSKAGVPWGRRNVGGLAARAGAAGSGPMGVELVFPNGTVIQPIAVGYPPEAPVPEKRCNGYEANSYVPNGETYLKTFDTQIVGSTSAASPEARDIEVEYTQSYSRTTTFELSIGDPFGIISATVGFSFTTMESTAIKYKFTVPAGQTGRVGFTPVYTCTKGTLKKCDGTVTEEQESCTVWKLDGNVQGDYSLIKN